MDDGALWKSQWRDCSATEGSYRTSTGRHAVATSTSFVTVRPPGPSRWYYRSGPTDHARTGCDRSSAAHDRTGGLQIREPSIDRWPAAAGVSPDLPGRDGDVAVTSVMTSVCPSRRRPIFPYYRGSTLLVRIISAEVISLFDGNRIAA